MTKKIQIKDLKPGDVFTLVGSHRAVVKAVEAVRFRIELEVNGTPHEIWQDGDKFVDVEEKG